MTGFLKAIQILHELYREKGFPTLVYQYEQMSGMSFFVLSLRGGFKDMAKKPTYEITKLSPDCSG